MTAAIADQRTVSARLTGVGLCAGLAVVLHWTGWGDVDVAVLVVSAAAFVGGLCGYIVDRRLPVGGLVASVVRMLAAAGLYLVVIDRQWIDSTSRFSMALVCSYIVVSWLETWLAVRSIGAEAAGPGMAVGVSSGASV